MGLYDDKAAIVDGDILDAIYWEAKFSALRLDAAIETRQPEGAIGLLLPAVINGCADVLKEYPRHEEVRQWQKEALLLQGRINPYAPPADVTAGFNHWNDPSYEAGWRSYHLAKMSVSSEYWGWARSFAADAVKYFRLTTNRMTEWPPNVREWIRIAQKEMEDIREDAARRIEEHFREPQEFSEIASGGK